MRVLIAAALLAGCYDPTIADCQFTCGPQNACPDGTSCSAGMCRTGETTQACTSGGGCPMLTSSDCTLVSAGSDPCLAECTSTTTWDTASSGCATQPGWHLAVLDSSAELAGAKAKLSAFHWIGLSRSTAAADWLWLGTSETVPTGGSEWQTGSNGGLAAEGNCAALDGDLYYSTGCETVASTGPYPYACTSN